MHGINALWVIALFVSGCTGPGYVATGLQPDNCGTPYQFKDCGSGSHVVGAVRPARPVVVVEELAGPTRGTPAPAPHDLINYSRLSRLDHPPLTPALGMSSQDGESEE